MAANVAVTCTTSNEHGEFEVVRWRHAVPSDHNIE